MKFLSSLKVLLTGFFSATTLVIITGGESHACGGGHLYRFGVGDTRDEIINSLVELGGICPNKIILQSMPMLDDENNIVGESLAVCQNDRHGEKKILLIRNGIVVAEKTGPKSFGQSCWWYE